MKSFLKTALVALSIMTAAPALAQDPGGDAKAGFAYAEGVCAECHAIKKGERVSPHERAPAFEVVANSRGMSEMALRVWFQSPHPSMPNLILKENLADDLVAYIMSLKQGRRTGSGS